MKQVEVVRSEVSDAHIANDAPCRFVLHARILHHVEPRARLDYDVAPESAAAPCVAAADLIEPELMRHPAADRHADCLGDARNSSAVIWKLRHNLPNRSWRKDDARMGNPGDRRCVVAANATSNERPQQRGATRAERTEVLLQSRFRRLVAEDRTDVMNADNVIIALALKHLAPLREHAKEAEARLRFLRDGFENFQHRE